MRSDGRRPDQLRPTSIKRGVLKFADGSALIETGNTRVIVSATVEERVPQFLQGTGKGWITAEYAMLPRSAPKRIPRESITGRLTGRTQEIQRFIGRSLRCAVDLKRLGERTIIIDCDVLQADGGTRTASVTAGFVALQDAIGGLIDSGALEADPVIEPVCAVSVGIVDGTRLLDLNYEEDSVAEVDMNVVMTGGGRYIEIGATAEALPFTEEDLHALLGLARKGITELLEIQKESLSGE